MAADEQHDKEKTINGLKRQVEDLQEQLADFRKRAEDLENAPSRNNAGVMGRGEQPQFFSVFQGQDTTSSGGAKTSEVHEDAPSRIDVPEVSRRLIMDLGAASNRHWERQMKSNDVRWAEKLGARDKLWQTEIEQIVQARSAASSCSVESKVVDQMVDAQVAVRVVTDVAAALREQDQRFAEEIPAKEFSWCRVSQLIFTPHHRIYNLRQNLRPWSEKSGDNSWSGSVGTGG